VVLDLLEGGGNLDRLRRSGAALPVDGRHVHLRRDDLEAEAELICDEERTVVGRTIGVEVPGRRIGYLISVEVDLGRRVRRIEELEAVIAEGSLTVEAIPREALFLAGKVYLSYRRTRGIKRSVLPDFYIGAHAAVMQWPILTRDVTRYRTHYPTVHLITP